MRAARIAQLGGSFVYTRNHPRRAEAVLRGGSLYWVIRGQIRARQPITGFRGERDDKGRAYCLIGVAPELIATVWRPWRPFQGWRYLSPADAPADRKGPDEDPDERLLRLLNEALEKTRTEAEEKSDKPHPGRAVITQLTNDTRIGIAESLELMKTVITK